MARRGSGSPVLLDWASISYRSIMRTVVYMVLLAALGGLFYYLKASLRSTPEDLAMQDLARAPQPYGYQTVIQSLQWREAEGRRKMVRTRDWKYVHDPMGDQDELYDLRKDPWELDNRIDDPANRGVIDGLARRLLDWSIRTEDVEPVPLPG